MGGRGRRGRLSRPRVALSRPRNRNDERGCTGRELAVEGQEEAVGRLLVDLGRQGMDSADYTLSASFLAAAVEISPSSSLAWNLLGQARALNREWHSAEQPLRRAVELGRSDLKIGLDIAFGVDAHNGSPVTDFRVA